MTKSTKINQEATKMNTQLNEKFVTEGDKEVCYAKVQTGTHAGKVIRVYYIRTKDGVVCGKDLESKKVIAVGKGSMSPEFRAHYNLTSGRKGQDYGNILAEFSNVISTPVETPVQEMAEAAPVKRARKSK